MILIEDHTEQILAPFFGDNIASVICSKYPMTTLGQVKAACLGKYPLTRVRDITISRNKRTGMIRVFCNKADSLIYVITRRKA
jgi:hypothetical protein